MKHIFFIVFIFLGNISFAQTSRGGGNGNGRQLQNQNRQFSDQREVKILKATDIAGILYYDVNKVIKKVKIKNDDLKKSVSKAFNDYNFKIKEISLLNADKLRVLDVLMKSRRGSGRRGQNDDNETNKGDDFRQKMRKIIRPIRREIGENEVILNETLKGLLSEKQMKKWLKYQKAEKDKLKPKRPQANENQRQQQRQNRNGNGARRGF